MHEDLFFTAGGTRAKVKTPTETNCLIQFGSTPPALGTDGHLVEQEEGITHIIPKRPRKSKNISPGKMSLYRARE
jgi:hypothetical protein